jgi:pyruvate kinase
MIAQAKKTVKDEAIAKDGEGMAIAAGTPFGVSGATNLLKLEIV